MLQQICHPRNTEFQYLFLKSVNSVICYKQMEGYKIVVYISIDKYITATPFLRSSIHT